MNDLYSLELSQVLLQAMDAGMRAGSERRRMDFPCADMPRSYDREFAEVPDVH